MGLRELPMPVVAAVEGGAVGIGWSLVLACDLVVASREAFFSAPFLARGLVPDGGAAWYLTERIGRHRASESLLLGDRLSASDAQRMGLVNKVCEPSQAVAEALGTASRVASSDRGALELTKLLLARAEDSELTSYLALELATATLAQQSGAAVNGPMHSPKLGSNTSQRWRLDTQRTARFRWMGRDRQAANDSADPRLRLCREFLESAHDPRLLDHLRCD